MSGTGRVYWHGDFIGRVQRLELAGDTLRVDLGDTPIMESSVTAPLRLMLAAPILAQRLASRPRPARKKEIPPPPPDPAAQPTRQLRRKAERALAKLARRGGKSSAPHDTPGLDGPRRVGKPVEVQPPSPGSYPGSAGRGDGG